MLALSAAHFLAFWFWHAPAPYATALSDPLVYWVMQASLLGTATLLWRALLMPGAEPVSVTIAIVATVGQMGLLGALIAFAPAPLYAPHLATTEPWGLSPLADQQLAGLLMWVPGAIPYGFILVRLLRHWSRDWEPA